LIELTEGNYALSGTDKRWGAQLHVLSGQEYFLRFEFVQGLLLGRLALTLVPTEQGSYESGHLKVADSKLNAVSAETLLRAHMRPFGGYQSR